MNTRLETNPPSVNPHILLVEDQQKMAAFIKRGLSQSGYSVDIAESGGTAETMVSKVRYDLIILDVMLPDQSGLDTARNLRKSGYMGPILMATALSGTLDRTRGLDAGADDYLVKPFDLADLEGRLRTLLRRSLMPGTTAGDLVLRVHDLEINLVTRLATRQGKTIHLTPKEFSLLEYLMRNSGRTVSRASIAEAVWEIQFDDNSNVIDVYVNTLRKKIDRDAPVKLIHTVSTGYILNGE